MAGGRKRGEGNRDRDRDRGRHRRSSCNPGARSLSRRQRRMQENKQRSRRKTEWWCYHCRKPNYLDRSSCRGCGTPSSGHETRTLGTEDIVPSQQQRATSGAEEAAAPVPGDARSSPARNSPSPKKVAVLSGRDSTARPISDAERARAFEEQSRQVKAISGDERIVAMLDVEAKEAWQAHRSRRPMGQRLDSARAACTSAEKELTRAAEAVRRALQQHSAVEHQLQRAMQEYQGVQAENAPVEPSSVRELARCSRETVDWLETHALGLTGPGRVEPEELQRRMDATRSALDAAHVEEEDTSDYHRMHEAEEEPPGDAPVTAAPPSPRTPPSLSSEEARAEWLAGQVIARHEYAQEAATQASPLPRERSRSPRGGCGGAAS